MLCVTSFAARYSAFIPIEHLWSVLSKKLASVQLSAIATSDDKAPYYISGITDEQRKAKESQVFDDAIEEIADVHWNNAVFDGFPPFLFQSSVVTTLQVIMRKCLSF